MMCPSPSQSMRYTRKRFRFGILLVFDKLSAPSSRASLARAEAFFVFAYARD